MIVENALRHPLERVHDEHRHGGFAVTPSEIVPRRSVAIFSSRAHGAEAGAAGACVFEIHDDAPEASALRVDWDNPCAGTQRSDALACRDGGEPSALYYAASDCGETPSSSASWGTVLPLLLSRATASRRNSNEYGPGIGHHPPAEPAQRAQRSGVHKSGELHRAS